MRQRNRADHARLTGNDGDFSEPPSGANGMAKKYPRFPVVDLHTMLALQFFLPTGHYQSAQVDVASQSIDALNASKNRFAFDPTLSMTWFDPASGLELTGALGVTFSARNDATDYQTAPEAHLEVTAMQHLKNKVAVGLTGYAYHQIGDNSGSGAANLRAALGLSSLESRVFGLGPIVSWSTQIGNVPFLVKA